MKAEVDLDWLDSEIEKLRNKGANSKTEEKLDFREEKTLLKIRSKCTPIEEVEQVIVDSQGGMEFVFTKLPPTCIQEWESARYCQNENKCQMCVTKNKQLNK